MRIRAVVLDGERVRAAGVSIPVHWTGGGKGAGLPMGIQLIGPMGSEALLLQLAAQLGF